MKAIVTVIGKDQVGITAAVCSLLAQHSINILDISQTILQEYFTMVMLVDTTACDKSIVEISQLLEDAGRERNLSIRIQREDIFNAGTCPSASSGRISLTPCIGFDLA